MSHSSLVLNQFPQDSPSLQLREAIDSEEGYSIKLKLAESELEFLRKMVKIQWLYRLQLLMPKQVHQFDEFGIERYHELSHLIDHAKAWPKYSRVLPREAVALIKEMDFFKRFEAEFGPAKMADEEKLGWENVYWRLVRPGNKDCGSIHADRWFVELGYYGEEIKDPSYERIKMWIALYTEPEKNGLLVVPSSHRRMDWKWHEEEHYGLRKPAIDEDITQLGVILLPTEPGRVIIFNYDLLHGGAPNLAGTTRVSIEFNLLIKKMN